MLQTPRQHHRLIIPAIHTTDVSASRYPMGKYSFCIYCTLVDAHSFCELHDTVSPLDPNELTLFRKVLFLWGPQIRRRSKFSRVVMEADEAKAAGNTKNEEERPAGP